MSKSIGNLTVTISAKIDIEKVCELGRLMLEQKDLSERIAKLSDEIANSVAPHVAESES